MSDNEQAASDAGMFPKADLAAFRLIVGVAQGLALWALLGPMSPPDWTRDVGILWTPMVLVAIGVPVILIGGIGQMRVRSLLLWAFVAALALTFLGIHDAGRISDGLDRPFGERTPSPVLLLLTVPALFIAHHLVVAADQDRRVIASYPRYFDIGWTSATQIALAGALVLALWIIIFLGVTLFGAIGASALQDILRNPLFIWPAVCVTFALAIQLTDTRASLVRGARLLGLTLLSWLMPVMTIFVVLFLLALPFTGLEPLWGTGSATPILLSSAAAVVALVNAAWQDGGADRTPSRFLAGAGVVARLTVFPLVALAAISTWLRIDQYGLTPDRVAALVATLIALVYAAGYLLSVLPPWRSRPILERTNIAAAVVCLVAWLAVFSPVADPARISVDDQVARLLDGRTKVDRFDFGFLRWHAARYGKEALAKLSTTTKGPEASRIAELAANALKTATPYEIPPPIAVENRITVWPRGRELPQGFLWQDAQYDYASIHSECFRWSNEACDAILVDLDRDGAEEIMLVNVYQPRGAEPYHFWSASYIEIFRMEGAAWTLQGRYDPPCREELEAMKRGEASFAPSLGPDLMINGQRLLQQPDYNRRRQCP